MRNNIVSKIKGKALGFVQKVGASVAAPSNAQIQLALFGIGITLIAAGLAHNADAASVGISINSGGIASLSDNEIHYNDVQVASATVAILTYIEGAFGALVMVGSGIAAILAAAFGQYRAALGALVVAVGAFILRSILSTFFNTESIDGLQPLN